MHCCASVPVSKMRMCFSVSMVNAFTPRWPNGEVKVFTSAGILTSGL